MTDIRERHVERFGLPLACRIDHQPWPCDAIREADRADLAESMLAMARADFGKAESDHVNAVTDWRGALERAERAEAALAEAKEAEMSWFRGAMQAEQERDAARKDAKALAEASWYHEFDEGDHHLGIVKPNECGVCEALAAHMEATDAR
jgi:hypothetical protein